MLAHEIDDRGKIQGAVVFLDEVLIDLRRVGADGGFGLHRIRGRFGKLEILEHQGRGEARLVAVIGRARRHRPGHRAIAGQRPALARRRRDHVEHRLVRQAEFFAEHKSLADRDHRGAEDHVVADFRHLAVAGVAALAPPTPPDTGASRVATPFAAAIPCALRALATSMVEQSMNSVPWRACGAISFHTESTCSPAGSMVTTMSAFSTVARALATIWTPSFAEASRDAGTTSKPEIWWPDFTRLAAIGAPILPKPINPMVAMCVSFLVVEFQFQCTDRT